MAKKNGHRGVTAPPPAADTLEEGKEATEATGLIAGVLPSPNSTEQPSLANLPIALSRQLAGYGTEESEPLVELASLPSNIHAANGEFGEKGQKRTLANRLGWSGIAVLVLLSLLLIRVSFTKHHGNTTVGPSSDHPPQHWYSPPTSTSVAIPLSLLDPMQDLGLYKYKRDKITSPPPIFNQTLKTYPTNAWYQNMLLAREEPILAHRAYAVPYLLDAVGTIPGLRVHPNRVDANTNLVQLTFVEQHSITLGADRELRSKVTDALTHSYSVLNTKSLALTLEWNAYPMKSSIVRGMPYATMTYGTPQSEDKHGHALLPSLGADATLRFSPIIDGISTTMNCSLSVSSAKMLVKREMELTFKESDFTWLIFFSQPVWVQCGRGATISSTVLQVISVDDTDDSTSSSDGPLIMRAALLDFCTTGSNPIYCKQRQPPAEVERFRQILQRNADIYPGENADVEVTVQDEQDTATLTFQWDPQNMRSSPPPTSSQVETSRTLDPSDGDLIMYCLPHHMDKFNYSLVPTRDQHCVPSLTGPACLINGANWTIHEDLLITSFTAPRLPTPESLFQIAAALKEDINYTIPDYYQQAIGDTYFSGKMLAKLGRILIVAEELKDICKAPTHQYKDACGNITLPSQDKIDGALDMLRRSTEIWINGKGVTPFVYDMGWGGVISCGCLFDHGHCNNIFPDCPAFSDPGLNFGNGFYNDMHYHYGYMIYASAIVAHFDSDWGRTNYEGVLLLIRNIANPSEDDVHFPKYRHKDWFQGSSWASGVAIPPNLNGKNQESSSEAIAAYEAVALFGTVMIPAWKEMRDLDKVVSAQQVRKVGRLLAATEVRSARRYWHVRREASARVYPAEYASKVVGMMWSTSVQFQTWFGLKAFLAYGIQLLPLTPISEDRDGLDWAKEMYEPFADSCHSDKMCVEFGWSILQWAMLATVGHPALAASMSLQLTPDAFNSAGGNGHSLTNTLWYIATRPNVTYPIPVPESDMAPDIEEPTTDGGVVIDCGVPRTCDREALNTVADGSTCRERIVWLMQVMQKSQLAACSQIGYKEYPTECGTCNPTPNSKPKFDEETAKRCPPCTVEECGSQILNRCPSYSNTFVCTSGPSTGGCLGAPWILNGVDCLTCCEMTECQVRSPPEDAVVPVVQTPDCPPCANEVCQSRLNMCPVRTAPYLCAKGVSAGGCSPIPWKMSTGDCAECCEVTSDCHH